jgi:hypothetical protein
MALRKQIQDRLKIIESKLNTAAYKSEEALYRAAKNELEWVLDQMEENMVSRSPRQTELYKSWRRD